MRLCIVLTGLLLLAPAVETDPLECSGPVCLRLQQLRLQQLAADKLTIDYGKPVRRDIFCSTSLSAVSRTTATASQAVEALCKAQDKSNALDAWMAARIIDHSSALHFTDRPMSTEPNTPWMLADIVLSSNQAGAEAS